MASKRLLSNSSMPKSSIVEDKKDKKLKRSMVRSPDSENVVVKDNSLKAESVEIQSIKHDRVKIEAMTVHELRTMLRWARLRKADGKVASVTNLNWKVGLPAKGRKCELVSALKCFVDKKLDGESSQEAGGQISSICAQDVSLEKKANNLSDENSILNINTVSEVCELKQSKKRVKNAHAADKTVKVDTEIVTRKERLSINTDEVSAGIGKPSRARRKISPGIGDVGIKADDLFTIPQAEPWTVLAHKKPQKGWVPYNPRNMRPPPLAGDTKFVKLMSWNVNGLRALLKIEGLSVLELAKRENFDVLCLQETKLQERDVDSIKQCLLEGYENSFWTCSLSKLGYSGTAIVSRMKPLSVTYGIGIPDHDSEGRVVTAEFDSFYLMSVYVPNSGDGLKRLSYRIMQWDPSLSNYVKELEKSKPVILTGDLNCAHQEIDIYNPAGNKRSAGFTDEERQSFGTNFLSRGFVDTFRKQHPNVVGYTYWGYRHGARKTNKGWRLDYFLVSESIADCIHDSYIVPDVTGSDHCPIGLILKL